jgi:hypothetical protein
VILALAEAVLIMVVAGAVLVVLIRAAGEALGGGRLAEEQRAELARLTALVDDLRELAWDHRDIDPDLSTIILDRIRTSERNRRELP